MVLLEIRQIADLALTDEGHGNISLKNEQHLFTFEGGGKILRKKPEKLWKKRGIVYFVTLKPQGRWNEGFKTNNPISEDCRVPSFSHAGLFSVSNALGRS